MWINLFSFSGKMELRFLLFGLYALLISQTLAIQQYFRVVPRSSRVLEGGEVVLECEIAALAGQVQWAKDGFALGFASNIPGHPRYTMIGDRRHGVYNLRIANATLDDDAEYQCQVGPAMAHRVIRANASLTVISPPTSVEIVGHQTNSKIEIRENDNISLECLVKNAKPPARIYWYRGNVELKRDDSEKIQAVESSEGSKKSTRYTTRSTIHLKPKSDDDYAEFSCEARHEALQRDFPMRATVQLSVLYPPGAPYIEGYAEGETVRRGQTLELVCRSRGGNPPAQLIWYKNGEQIRMAYRTAGRVSENVLTFTADASDNKARYRCEAKNVMITNVLKAEIDLTVLFAPTHISISGPSEAKVGDPVPLTCATAPSNPPAEIKWMVIGKHFKNATSRTVISPEGGWITTSNITVVVEPNRRSLVVVCHGLNMQLTENVVSTHTINVLYPPSSPLITGYQQGTILAAGTVQRMLCVSSGGNPLATLKWFKNDKEVHSQTKITDKSVSSEITILTNVTDNLAQYKCEAANSATDIPLFESVTLNVHFAPVAVEIDVQPALLRPGDIANLTCQSASSNPPAALSWWKDGIPVQGLPTTSISGLHGGTVTYIGLLLNLTKEMNGAVYTCQAMNEALQRSVHDARTLRILYAPIFDPIAPEISMGIEGEPLIIVLKADANPSSVAYTWSKDGLPIPPAQTGAHDRITSEGSMLNISTLSRDDAGVYACEASNSQGEAVVHINVTVQYPASIKYVTKNLIVAPGEDARLECMAVGNPLNEEHIKWTRKGYNFLDHTSTTFDNNGTSFLLIKKANRKDVGVFQCVVDNGIKNNKSSQDTMLIVKFQPEMDSAPNLTKSASNQHEVGRLTCKCDAAPSPTFTWSKGGLVLSTNTSGKYIVEYHQLGPVTYSSVLLVYDVSATDYGQYVCAAKNEMGNATIRVKLNVTSSPDQVESLTVTNVTHDSVSLSWVPGFDGGRKPTYRIRYRPYDENGYTHKDVIEPNSTSYVVSDLKLGTHYLFSIMAINALGQSQYRPDDIDATTLSELPPSYQSPSSDNDNLFPNYPGVLIITGTIVGTAIILLNVLLIGFCLHKRSNKIRIRASSTEIGELNEVPIELVDKAELPRMVIVYVSITAAVLVAINLVLVSCFFLRRRAKRMKEQAGQASKSATIEMYAPSSYNDTITGETLSSVSEKSETYSNEDDDLHDPMSLHGHAPPVPDVPTMPSRHTLLQPPDAYLLDDMNDMGIPPPGSMDYPPPNYRAYEAGGGGGGEHARTLPHPHHARHKDAGHSHTLTRNNGKQSYVTAPSPMPPLDGSYYNMSSDRYLSYPPLINEYLHQTQIGRTPTPPHQYIANPGMIQPNTKMANTVMMNGGVSQGSPLHGNNMNGSPPPNYMSSDIGGYVDRLSLGGTLRRRGDKLSAHTQHTHTGNVPPPDVTVLHPGCNQQHTRSPQTPGNIEKQPQSILKDPSRHKQYQQYNHGSPLGTSTPLTNTSNQILTVQNLAANDSLQSGMPTYGTIKKENKKNQVNIDDGNKHERETHVV